ncbi:hypothetical protein ABGT15_05960 [Flavobacterium enshiense]|uniref:hypothetical protein n=1 Tax=Flavobacterium enshiense TaxID=1341165 RepID=UPI00345D2807
MALLRNYGFQTELDSGDFEFNFDIPNNCNFTTSYDATKNYYTVSIQLNSGQTQPSSTYVTQYHTFSSSGSIVDVRFQETLNGVVSKRPRTINNESTW